MAIKKELERSNAALNVLKTLAELLVLINKNELQRLVANDPRQWQERGSGEFQERALLKFLGKACNEEES